jgi:hypothetical protein
MNGYVNDEKYAESSLRKDIKWWADKGRNDKVNEVVETAGLHWQKMGWNFDDVYEYAQRLVGENERTK